jgi:hypothetical protein
MTDDLGATIDRLATELDGATRRESAGAVEFVRAGVVFATREGSRLSFRLRSEIVEAALHTAGTSKSARGPEWVALDSALPDEFTRDRAIAWFETAWRMAGEPPESRPLAN